MEDIVGKDTILDQMRAIAHDDVSGATDLTLRAADLLLLAIAAGEGEAVAEALLRAKPVMASLLNLACLARGQPDEAAARVRAFRDGLARAPARAAREAVAFLARREHGPWTTLTLSASRAVEETILALADDGMLSSVVVAESRPRLEGQEMARRLVGRVSRVAVTHDAALPGLCTPESLVLVGADAVLADAIANKSGSLALCLAARDAGAARLVVTTSHKVLRHEATPYFRWPAMDPDTPVCRDAATFLDIQFERVPRHLVEAVVTEDGPIP